VTRETRLNLWFLAIFLIISLPGAVILFIKKLDPSASRMDEPDAVRMQLPYMAPVPAPPEMRWMVPPVTHRWLTDLTQQKTGGPMASAVPPGPEWEPVISPDHRLQVMSVRAAGGTTHLALTVWDTPLSDDASRINPKFQANGHELPASIVRNGSIEIPAPIRYELVNLGFAHPPARIEWIDCEVKGPIEPNDHITLTLAGAKAPAAQSSVSWTVR
jgi:hypothetical protein